MREIGEHVLVSIRQSGRGKRSGIEMRGEAHMVFTLRAGKVIRWQMFSTEAEGARGRGPGVGTDLGHASRPALTVAATSGTPGR